MRERAYLLSHSYELGERSLMPHETTWAIRNEMPAVTARAPSSKLKAPSYEKAATHALITDH